jgi:hypothetical protein
MEYGGIAVQCRSDSTAPLARRAARGWPDGKGDRHHKRSWLHRDVLHERKNCGMASEIQTATLAGQAFPIGERSEFEPLQAWVRTVEDGDLPK